MSASKHENSERLARQQAAERLTDVAYALLTGGPLVLGPGRQLSMPVADEVVLKRVARSTGERLELELELSWPTPETRD